MKYKILAHEKPEKLESMVNDLLSEGWECQGGLNSFFMPNSQLAWFSQAMVKQTK